MATKTVLVTGIGGNVGQGILRNISNLPYPIKKIGTNTELISAGNHLCDAVYLVPYAFDPTYILKMIEICHSEKVDLIIPGTDFETFYLASNSEMLPQVAASPAATSFIFLDKYVTWQHFAKHGIPFAASALPGEYNGEFSEIIVKPRKGRGSRGITINPSSVSEYDPDEYMIQQLHKGPEITTAFYVTKGGDLLGHITMVRTLSAGTTNTSVVTFEYDTLMEDIIRKMLHTLEIKGSCNIQSIVTDKGTVVPFEINGRISGTNSIRANFGFEDVRYTLEEYLLGTDPEPPVIKKGAAIRILMDVIYPGASSLDQLKDNSTQHYIY